MSDGDTGTSRRTVEQCTSYSGVPAYGKSATTVVYCTWHPQAPVYTQTLPARIDILVLRRTWITKPEWGFYFSFISLSLLFSADSCNALLFPIMNPPPPRNITIDEIRQRIVAPNTLKSYVVDIHVVLLLVVLVP
jgi:hypothetical protein